MMDVPNWTGRCVGVWLVVLGLTGFVSASPAAERPGGGAWMLGAEIQQRTFDTMSAGDARPGARGDVGVRFSLDHLVTPHWTVGISGHFGGTWLHWTQRTYNISGTLEDVSWDTRLGVDRLFPLGVSGAAFAGAGVEYGEARSWVRDDGSWVLRPGPQEVINGRGPRNFMTGGFARLGALAPLGRRVTLCAQVSESFYDAHALMPPLRTDYRWLGRSMSASLGLRFTMVRGRHASR